MLKLLGDELIGSTRLAVFELVKNAYDADSSQVVVRLELDSGNPLIVVSDDGEGMSLDVMQKVWLVPGDDHRAKQRKGLARTPKYNRLPLGEKGLGRFAVHKLGDRIELVTRAADQDECVVDIDWCELVEQPFLDQAPVTIRTRSPEVFKGDATGTRISIGELRQLPWTRGEVRRLQRQIISVSSPFQEPSQFRATLQVPGHEDWIADIPDVAEIFGRAIWKFSFSLTGESFDWTYDFRGVPGLKLDSRKSSRTGDRLKLPPARTGFRSEQKVVADRLTLKGIGPVKGEFHVYDRDRGILKLLPDMQLLKSYLDENGGIRVYRDGMRVYNYGEPGDDWLGLDLRRVQAPTRGISRNIILGAVHLQLDGSDDLVEKTSREGFVEDEACNRLRQIVLGCLGTLESERRIDKDRIRKVTGSDSGRAGIEKPIGALRVALKKQDLLTEFEPYVTKIEHDYKDMQETLLSAGMSGLNLAVVFHEVERGVRALHQVIVDGKDSSAAAIHARDLMHLLDGFTILLRRDNRRKHSSRKLLEAARRFCVLRLRYHKVRLVCPLLEGNSTGFEAKFAFSLVLGALSNLIDNSLYWMRVRWPEPPKDVQSTERQLYLDVSTDLSFGSAIVVADTGPGFQGDEPELLVRPFFTRKPDGMGLGLYYSNLAMELNGGQLVFPERGDVGIPSRFDGAVTALVFEAEK